MTRLRQLLELVRAATSRKLLERHDHQKWIARSSLCTRCLAELRLVRAARAWVQR